MKVSAVIDSFVSWLRGLLVSGEGEAQQPTTPPVEPSKAEPSPRAAPPVEPRVEPSPRAAPPVEPPSQRSPREDALAYLSKVRAKVSRLAEDFNVGTINRAQFRRILEEYPEAAAALHRRLAARLRKLATDATRLRPRFGA